MFYSLGNYAASKRNAHPCSKHMKDRLYIY